MTRTRTALIVVLATLPCSGSPRPAAGQGIAFQAGAPGHADSIAGRRVRAHVEFIASDQAEGRQTPSRGLDLVANYLASHLAQWGVAPGGDRGTYFQHIALRRTRIDRTQTWIAVNGRRFEWGAGFLADPNPGQVEGGVVFVGHGWVVKAMNLDPYRGMDIKGKIVVVTGEPPPGITSVHELRGQEGVDYELPGAYAARHGALAIVRLPGPATVTSWDRQRRQAELDGRIEVAGTEPDGRLPTVTASPALLQVLGDSSTPAGRRAVPQFSIRPGTVIRIAVGVVVDSLSTQNVVALVPGQDPDLRGEYVAIGAHYDHLGIVPNGGDSVYNGADDNASGTAAVLEMARVFVSYARPRRSLLFIWHAGEEKDLWGSEYFTAHPTVPLRQIVAFLNLDMIGRTGSSSAADRAVAEPGEIFLVGPRLLSSDMESISEAVNRSYLQLRLNYRHDTITDSKGFFYRSDQHSYAREGIPVAFYFDGEPPDYHRPSDTAEKLDYENLVRVARTVHATAWELANRPSRPRLDRPVP